MSTPKKFSDLVGWETARVVDRAMLDAMREKGGDFSSAPFAAAWEYLHWFRGAGKSNAYGPREQAVSDEANSHALRGFIVGWAMCQALNDARKAQKTKHTYVNDGVGRCKECGLDVKEEIHAP